VKLFLDTSVLLAASGSDRGASREIFRLASECNWLLLASRYVIDEVVVNLRHLAPQATANWARLRLQLQLVDDILTLDRAAVFEPAKDRPILFTALAWSDVLLTLDRKDFGSLIGGAFYGLSIQMPGTFLELERDSGRLNSPE
jgi:predicted nucleic acid-binding protein